MKVRIGIFRLFSVDFFQRKFENYSTPHSDLEYLIHLNLSILFLNLEARAHLESEKVGYILKLNSRMDRVDAVREYCFKLREKLYAA